MTTPPSPSLTTILASLAILFERDAVVELRVLKTQYGVVSGYFTDHEKLAAEAARWSGKAPGVYVTLNPIQPDLAQRASNRAVHGARQTTSDDDILRRHWLQIDFDVPRDRDTSSTDSEHEAALARGRECRAWLIDQGIPEDSVISADSGNGAHLVVRIDLPNDDPSRRLVQRCLEALALRFSDDAVIVDLSTFNAARIWKLYGTLACKGLATPERPHRLAQVLDAPERLVVTPSGVLEKLAAMAPEEPKPSTLNPYREGAGFDLDAWITARNVPVRRTAPWKKGRLWVLNPCPWNPEHTNAAAYIVQFESGAIAAGCHHNGCFGKDWHALRDVYEPGWREAQSEKPTPSDLGNAKRLVARHGHELRYVAAWKTWYVWNGRQWAEDNTGQVERWAKETVKNMYVEAAKLDDDARQKLVKHALASENGNRIREMIALARSESEIALALGDLDSDPWLLNVLNGTIDLRTGELREHRPADLITKVAPVVYDPNARSAVWENFLQTVLPDPAVRRFVQRAVGYALTGDTREEKLFFLHGPEATGKSTFIEAVKAMMGDYAMTADFETFLKRKQVGGVRNDIAALVGARFVSSVEVEDGQSLATAIVKQMTGGDKIRARKLYKEGFEFVPEFKLFLAANDAPKVRVEDGGMWRRILRVPFEVMIPPERRDPTIKATLRDPAVAGPAILAWAVEGCLAWQREGLGVPQAVQEATVAYRQDMDALREFVEDCCVEAPAAWTASAELRKAYEDWCWRNGVRDPLDADGFTKALHGRGYSPQRRGKGRTRGWGGVGLLAHETEADRRTAADTVLDNFIHNPTIMSSSSEPPTACVRPSAPADDRDEAYWERHDRNVIDMIRASTRTARCGS